MKRYFILIALLSLFVVSGLCAFTKGTINPGGSISYSSTKYDANSDTYTVFSFTPQLGYFFADDLSGDFLINYNSQAQGDISLSDFGVGIGGRYFHNQFYVGLGFMLTSQSFDYGDGTASVSADYLDLKAGYLVPVVKNVYVDLGIKYEMGIGSYGGDGSGSNNETQFGFNAGFQLFFPAHK
jgi:hypothetical protein